MGSRRPIATALACLFVLALPGCERVVLEVQGDTLIARPSVAIPIGGVLAGLAIVALGGLVAKKGKSTIKRIAGGALFVTLGFLFAVCSVASYGKFYSKGDGEQIVQAQVLFGEPRVTLLDPLTHVSVHRVRRQRKGGGPKRRWVTLFWLHRPDGTIDRVSMSGYLNRPVREHVLTKLAERGVPIEDLRDQAD